MPMTPSNFYPHFLDYCSLKKSINFCSKFVFMNNFLQEKLDSEIFVRMYNLLHNEFYMKTVYSTKLGLVQFPDFCFPITDFVFLLDFNFIFLSYHFCTFWLHCHRHRHYMLLFLFVNVMPHHDNAWIYNVIVRLLNSLILMIQLNYCFLL